MAHGLVNDVLRAARPPRPKTVERRFETLSGRQAQVDFAQFRVEFVCEPGVTRILWLFTLILGHSRLASAEVVEIHAVLAVEGEVAIEV